MPAESRGVMRLRAPEGYSLADTLLPSLTLPMFERRGARYVKVAGHRRGPR